MEFVMAARSPHLNLVHKNKASDVELVLALLCCGGAKFYLIIWNNMVIEVRMTFTKTIVLEKT